MKKIDELVVNTIRVLSAEAVEKAKSGHPGLPMGSAPMAYTLWAKHLKHNPKNANWVNRDRFVLSAGHGSMLIYSLLNIFGYPVSMDDIKDFRQLGSKTPGHPEFGHTVGVETTTGPLGQGICNAVGMAMAEEYLAKKFNKPGFPVVDHFTYTLAGDGCLMEGVSGEACSLAGTLELGKLILLYDSNNITIEGDTDIAFRESVEKRYEAYGWQVINVEDGTDVDDIEKAISSAKEEKKKPSIIIIKTQIGYGCPAKVGKASAHGEPLGEANLEAARIQLGWKEEPFTIPSEVIAFGKEFVSEAEALEEKWNKMFSEYRASNPDLSKEWDAWFEGIGLEDIKANEEFWKFEKSMATRDSSGILINRLTKLIPNLVGGSADLAPSNKTYMTGKGDFSAEDKSGANLHFGVREFAMGAIANGIAIHGGLRVFAATFFVFSDYMKAAVRLSALMKLPVTYVFTHDSIGVGEDGPTHQPVEHLAALRSIPDMVVIRPADNAETAAAWYLAATKKNGPVALVLSRQGLPILEGTGTEALKGAYILKDSEKKTPDILLMASGSEVSLILKAAEALKLEGIDSRVISVPSWELFEAQGNEYKEKIMPKEVRARLAVEAGSYFGWHKYIGLDGDTVTMDTFGASGKADELFVKFGFTVENVVKKAKKLLINK